MAEPVRTCVACGRTGKKHLLQRFVWRVDQPYADDTGSAHGRGAYCCRSDICLQKFGKQKKKWKRLFRL